MRSIILALTLMLFTSPAWARQTYALIVTNNHSAGRGELKYADDDGAKYYELFSLLGAGEQVRLLTRMDRDTERLFPAIAAIAKPPTIANLHAELEALRASMDKQAETDFYFVFAGHGDVDHGKGFLELADGRIGSDELQALLARVPHAIRKHVILDSCNFYFVLNPRKPGGRRFFTHDDAAHLLGERLPNVGVFLSTSSEAEVYEWSDLQSGIFSHAVRSGLLGAADADGDGRISYEELEAFVTIAARSVKNPLYRPHVFARPPLGARGTPIVDLRRSQAATLVIEGERPQRVTVRDHDELPWVDVHTEAGSTVRVRLPERLANRMSVEELEGGRIVRRRANRAATSGAVTLAMLPETNASALARGPADLFRMLFAEPFGPEAFERYQSDPATAPPPLGVSGEDLTRMHTLLEQTAGIARARRLTYLAAGLALGGAAAIAGGVLMRHGLDIDRGESAVGLGLTLGAGVTLILSPFNARKSRSEKAFSTFQEGLRSRRDLPLVLAQAERHLFAMAKETRSDRRTTLISGWGLAGLSSGLLLMTGLRFGLDVNSSSFSESLTLALMGIAAVGLPLGMSRGIEASFETPEERMVRLWSADPAVPRVPRLTAVALPSGGGMLSMSGSF
jgi:hypothetical protein